MNLEELKVVVEEKSAKYPTLAEEFQDLYGLAEAESADECESEEHECDMCMNDIEELIKQELELPF